MIAVGNPVSYEGTSKDPKPSGLNGDEFWEVDTHTLLKWLSGAWRKMFILESNSPQSKIVISMDVLPTALSNIVVNTPIPGPPLPL